MQEIMDARTLAQAAARGAADKVKAHLAAGVDVNAVVDNGNTALMTAAARGRGEIVGILLAAGADVNAANEDGFTALLSAVFSRQSGVVRTLLEHGADIDATTRLGSTALGWASSKGFTEVVSLLRAAGSVSVAVSGASPPEIDDRPRVDPPPVLSSQTASLPAGAGVLTEEDNATTAEAKRRGERSDRLFDRAGRWGMKSKQEMPWRVAVVPLATIILVSGMSVYLLIKTDEQPTKYIPAGAGVEDYTYEYEAPRRHSPAVKNRETAQSNSENQSPFAFPAASASGQSSRTVKNEKLSTAPNSPTKKLRLAAEDAPAVEAEVKAARREQQTRSVASKSVDNRRRTPLKSNASRPAGNPLPTASSSTTDSSPGTSLLRKKKVIEWP